MKGRALLPLVGSLVLLLGSGLGWAGQYDEKERAELARALKGAKVSLKQGIVASAPKGKPISGKFEVEDGKLQLSVYTAEGRRVLRGSCRSEDGTGGEGRGNRSG